MQFSHYSMGTAVTCRADTSPSEVLLPRCAEGQPSFPTPASTGRHTGTMLFWTPEHIGGGIGTTPHSSPHPRRINLIPLSINWQSLAPLGETDTVPIGRSWKMPLHSSPQRQFDYLNMPQTDCPCQWLLVQDVAQLWFLKQSAACNTARSLYCNADFK